MQVQMNLQALSRYTWLVNAYDKTHDEAIYTIREKFNDEAAKFVEREIEERKEP